MALTTALESECLSRSPDPSSNLETLWPRSGRTGGTSTYAVRLTPRRFRLLAPEGADRLHAPPRVPCLHRHRDRRSESCPRSGSLLVRGPPAAARDRSPSTHRQAAKQCAEGPRPLPLVNDPRCPRCSLHLHAVPLGDEVNAVVPRQPDFSMPQPLWIAKNNAVSASATSASSTGTVSRSFSSA